MQVSIIHHVGIVLFILWLISQFNCSHPVAYFVSLIYLYQVHERYFMKLRRKLKYDERKQANQKRVRSDSETVQWLNYAVGKMWPICMEQITSQKILLPIVPWFLEKYNSWIVKKVVVQHLYMGRNPPVFTEVKVLHLSKDDDILVLESGMNFQTADDMSAILAVQLSKRLGYESGVKLQMTGMHVEGKVLVRVKLLRNWPFFGELRVCFIKPPYFHMTVKPICTHGLDVVELPEIAEWMDELLSIAFKNTFVKPNVLVVDVEKLVSPYAENCFFVDEKEAVAYVKVEVLEASDMKPFRSNGLADPYVKGQLGVYRFKTMTQKGTLVPKWYEEFKIPIVRWDFQSVLAIEVWDECHSPFDFLGLTKNQNHFLGDCSINIGSYWNGQRHDMWLPLQNILKGRLHLAVTVIKVYGEEDDYLCNLESLEMEDKRSSFASETTNEVLFSSVSLEKSNSMADDFERINIKWPEETEPRKGKRKHLDTETPLESEVSQSWEPRKGKSRHLDTENRLDSEDDHPCDLESLEVEDKRNSFSSESTNKGSFSSEKSNRVADNFEPINIEGQKETGIWVHHPGSDVSQTWKPKKVGSWCLDKEIHREPNVSTGNFISAAPGSQNYDSSSDENPDDKHSMKTFRRGPRKIGSVFYRSSKKEDNSKLGEPVRSPRVNIIRAVNEEEIGAWFIADDYLSRPASAKTPKEGASSSGGNNYTS